MSLKIILAILFVFLIAYSFIRPFSSLPSKMFLVIGSFLGFLSVTDITMVNYIAEFLGISGGGKDLFLYISLVTIFLFIFYTAERFKKLETKTIKLARRQAIDQVKKP